MIRDPRAFRGPVRAASSVLFVLTTAAAGFASDELLLSGFSSATVTRYDASDGSSLGGLGPGGNLAGVLGVAVGLDGNLYVCSESNNRVVRYEAASGAYLDDFIADDPGTPGDETGGLAGPAGIVFGADGLAYVASFNNDSIRRYDGHTGAFVDVFVAPGFANLNGPDAGMAFGPDGNLYVPSFFSHRIKAYEIGTGAFLGNLVAPGFAEVNNPRMVTFPGDGHAYVASEGNDRILRVDLAVPQSVETFIVDDPGTPQDETGGLDGPTGVVFGPDGRIYVSSISTHSVLRYEADGTFVDEFIPPGLGGVALPTFLAFRPDAVNVCQASVNSTGRPARIGGRGFSSVGADDLTLTATSAPADAFGLFFYGSAQLSLPFGDGVRCAGGAVFRLRVTQAGPEGFASHQLDYANPPRPAGQILPGSSWFFQFWFRDPAGPGGSGFNTSDALQVSFSQ